MNDDLERFAEDIKRHFDTVNEATRQEVRLVAEAVAHLDAKLDRSVDRLDKKIDQTAAETQAMIRFSHAELDRRITTVQHEVADLRIRVERLESTKPS